MEVVNSISQLAPVEKDTTQGSSKLGREEFLKMFMEQLKNQDPMDPVEQKEMIGQLAALSSLEQDRVASVGSTVFLTSTAASAVQHKNISTQLFRGRGCI